MDIKGKFSNFYISSIFREMVKFKYWYFMMCIGRPQTEKLLGILVIKKIKLSTKSDKPYY